METCGCRPPTVAGANGMIEMLAEGVLPLAGSGPLGSEWYCATAATCTVHVIKRCKGTIF